MSVAPDTTGAFAHALGAAVSRVHLPGSAGYADLTATYNLCTRLTPLAVVEAQTAHDVAAAVRVAGEHGVPVGVQSTGHGPWATMAGAVLVATRGLDELMVDPVSRIPASAPGCAGQPSSRPLLRTGSRVCAGRHPQWGWSVCSRAAATARSPARTACPPTA